jgi:hypothetical protein
MQGTRTFAWVFGGFTAVAIVAYVVDHDLIGTVVLASIATAIFVLPFCSSIGVTSEPRITFRYVPTSSG